MKFGRYTDSLSLRKNYNYYFFGDQVYMKLFFLIDYSFNFGLNIYNNNS